MKYKIAEKKHLLDTIKDIQKALNEIKEEIEGNGDGKYWLMTLLCRVGELELCINYNFEIKYSKGKEVILKPNRLCECYEKLGGGDYET